MEQIIKNDDKNQFSKKLTMMKQFYRQKLQIQKEVHEQRGQQQKYEQDKQKNDNNQVFHQDAYSSDDSDYDTQNKEVQIQNNEQNIKVQTYFHLKEKLKEVEVDLQLKLINNAINKLEHIFLQSKVSLKKEQQKLLYVEVLTLCNKHAKQYLEVKSEITIAHLLLQKCNLWTYACELDPYMRVLSIVNLGVCFRKLGRISQSIDIFNEAIQIIQEKKYYQKIAELNGQIGEHDKALGYAKMALQQCLNDINSGNLSDYKKSGVQQVKILQRNNSKDQLNQSYNNQQRFHSQPDRRQSIGENKKKEINQNEKISSKRSSTQSDEQKRDNSNTQTNTDDGCDDKIQWTQNKFMNLILCYETLAKVEEHFLHFEEVGKLYTQAVQVAQENFGQDNMILMKQTNKLLSFQKRYVDYSQYKQQNQIQSFSHLSINPLLQQSLNDKSIKINQEIIDQIKEIKTNQINNIFSSRKISSHTLQNSPYIQTYNQSQTPRQSSATRNSSTSRHNKVVIIRQKKLSLENVPSSLKFNVTNGTVPTQTSIISNSTSATNQQINRKQNQLVSFNRSGSERKISLCDEKNNTQDGCFQFKNLLQPKNNQTTQFFNNQSNQSHNSYNNKGSLTQRVQDSPKNYLGDFQIKSNNTSFQYDSNSIYPPPRLRSGKELNQTQKQRNSEIDSINSDKFKILIDNQLRQQQLFTQEQNAKYKIQQKFQNKNNQKGSILTTSYLSSPTNSLINSKPHLQTFVDQMKVKRNQLNLQFQQMNSQHQQMNPQLQNFNSFFQNVSPQSQLMSPSAQNMNILTYNNPHVQLYGDQLKQYKSDNGSRKILIYSDVKRVKKDSFTKAEEILEQTETPVSQTRQKSMSSYDQIQQFFNQQQNLVSQNQQQQIKQHLQDKIQHEETCNFQNNDPCSTTITTSTHSNSTCANGDKQPEFQKRKSLQIVQKTSFDLHSQQFEINKEQELLYEVKESQIKILNLKQDTLQQQENTDNNKNLQNICYGYTKFLFNKQSMIITIEFREKPNIKCNNQQKQQEQNEPSIQNTQLIYKHTINVSDIFTITQPNFTNKQFILMKLCTKIYTYLQIDLNIKQLVIKVPNQNLLKNDNKIFGFHQIIVLPQEDIQLHLVQKDHKSSIIYYKENQRIKSAVVKTNNNQISKKLIQVNSQINQQQYVIPQSTNSQLNHLNKQGLFFTKQNSKDFLDIIGEQSESQQDIKNNQQMDVECNNLNEQNKMGLQQQKVEQIKEDQQLQFKQLKQNEINKFKEIEKNSIQQIENIEQLNSGVNKFKQTEQNLLNQNQTKNPQQHIENKNSIDQQTNQYKSQLQKQLLYQHQQSCLQQQQQPHESNQHQQQSQSQQYQINYLLNNNNNSTKQNKPKLVDQQILQDQQQPERIFPLKFEENVIRERNIGKVKQQNKYKKEESEICESEKQDIIKSFDSSRCVDESAERKGNSLGSVKFISYYQVPTTESSFNSKFQFDEQNTLRNSSGFKDQKKTSNEINSQRLQQQQQQ